MRLIDADDRKLRTELVYYTCWTGIDEAPYLFAVDVLDKAPSVDAIPIEWIKNYSRKICDDDAGRYNSKAYGIDRMIYDWEKENGEDSE